MTPQEIEKAANDLIPDYIPGTHPKFYDREEAVTIFISGANLVMERVRKLEEALKLILPIVDEAYWDQWSAGNMPGSGFSNKAQHAAGQVFGWRDSKKFETWAKEIRAALEGKES